MSGHIAKSYVAQKYFALQILVGGYIAGLKEKTKTGSEQRSYLIGLRKLVFNIWFFGLV